MGRRDSRAKPYQRSISTHLRSIEFDTSNWVHNRGVPEDDYDGIDVSDWLSIILSIHPTDPQVNAITAGSTVTVRVWRYKKAAYQGTNEGSGQWYADLDWIVPLDGDGTGRMEQVYSVWGSEKIFVQMIGYEDPGGAGFNFRTEYFGIGPKYAEMPEAFETISASAAASATGTSNVNLIQVASNAVNVGAGAAGTGTLRVILASDTPGIGEHDAATDDPGFRSLWVATTADPAAVADQDDVHPIADVYGRIIIAGYNRTGDHIETALVAESLGLGEHDVATEADGFRALAVATNVDPAAVANQDDAHLITDLYGRLIVAGYDRDGDLIRVQETDPINFHIAWDLIEEASMGTTGSPYTYYVDIDSYYRMSHQLDITLGSADPGGVAYKIYGTVEDDDPDLTARTYIDRTTVITGGPSITVDDLIEDLNGIHGNYTAAKLEFTVVNASDDSAIRLDLKRFVGG